MQMSLHIGRIRPSRHICALKARHGLGNGRTLHAMTIEAQHAPDMDPALFKAATLRRVDSIQAEAATVVARSKACEDRYKKAGQLVSKVLVQERKRLIAAEQTYMRIEDTMREQVCLAEHSAKQGQTMTTQGYTTLQELQRSNLPVALCLLSCLQAAVRSEGTSQAAAVSMLVETVSAEVDRVRVHIRAMQQRRLQMRWALSRQDAGEVQQLRSALKQPGMLQVEVEEQAYTLVLQQMQDIRKCNKQLSASTIKHAAARTFKDKRRAHLIKALHTTAHVQQQQHLAGYMTQTLQKELVDKAASLAAAAADSEAQQQEQCRLQAVLAAYEELRQVRTHELELNTTASEEEVVLVFEFLEKMACQLNEAEQQLTALLWELQERTQAAQSLREA